MFNAYDAVKSIYDMKTGWHTADKAGDRKKADEYAKNAQQYYQQLMDNGYSDVADALKNTNDVGAKYIVDNFMKTYSAPVDTSKSSTPTATDTSSIKGKIDDLYGIQRSDRDTMAKKYDTLEDYNYNHNPYESKIGKSIMEDYKFQGETARDNATASGGASNGGNIDSYAAANANRQQLAFTNAGKQAVLNDFNTRISNARGILNELGVYQQNQDKGMQTTINQQQTEEQRKFDNEVTTSEVTGYVPESMQYSNNPFFNKDGTLINPDTTDYSQIITNARNKLKTTKDASERANLEKTINDALQARAYKILNVEGYGKWANTMEVVAPQETLTSKTTNKQLENDKHAIDTESATSKYVADQELEGTKHTNATNERISDKSNATSITVADINAKSAKEIAQLEAQAVEDETWQDIAKKASGVSDDAETFVNTYLYSMWVNETNEDIREVIETVKYDAESNPDGYKFTKNDVSKIITGIFGMTEFVLATDESGNPTKTISVSDWLNSHTWYNPKEDKTSDEDIDNVVENMK